MGAWEDPNLPRGEEEDALSYIRRLSVYHGWLKGDSELLKDDQPHHKRPSYKPFLQSLAEIWGDVQTSGPPEPGSVGPERTPYTPQPADKRPPPPPLPAAKPKVEDEPVPMPPVPKKPIPPTYRLPYRDDDDDGEFI